MGKMQYLPQGATVKKKVGRLLLSSVGYVEDMFSPLMLQLNAFLCLISKNWTNGLTFDSVASPQYTAFQECLS